MRGTTQLEHSTRGDEWASRALPWAHAGPTPRDARPCSRAVCRGCRGRRSAQLRRGGRAVHRRHRPVAGSGCSDVGTTARRPAAPRARPRARQRGARVVAPRRTDRGGSGRAGGGPGRGDPRRLPRGSCGRGRRAGRCGGRVRRHPGARRRPPRPAAGGRPSGAGPARGGDGPRRGRSGDAGVGPAVVDGRPCRQGAARGAAGRLVRTGGAR